MLKKALLWSIVGLLVITITGFAVQVDGYCYLENQQNHSGTRVLFEADSPTAETDSAFTDSTGYYQADINPGVYDVYIFHNGYATAQFLDQLVSSAMTFPEVTLMDVPDGIYISGEISGVLQDTTYLVIGDLVVNGGSSLTISPSAILYFLGDSSTTYNFIVYGSINAVGTETDTIKFLPAPGVPGWGGLWVVGEGIHLEYCLITGGTYWALRATNCDDPDEMVISHCTITGNSLSSQGALIIRNGCANVSYCTVSDNTGNGMFFQDIRVESIVIHCEVIDNTGTGIYCDDNSDELNIEFCVIAENSEDGVWCDDSFASLTNCTVSRNGHYGFTISNYSGPTIMNTIIEGNNLEGINFDSSPDASVSYCDIYDNAGGPFAGTPPDFLGTIITTNPNGDSCDAYYNIYVDPEFVDPGAGNFYLQSTSLCIDAGDPTSPPDPGGTPADIGAFYYDPLGVDPDPTPVIAPTEFSLSANYPNPFNPTTTLEFAVPTAARVNLVVYDVMGRKVATLVDGLYGAGSYKAVFDGSRLASGIYFVRMQVGDFHQVQKMVLLK